MKSWHLRLKDPLQKAKESENIFPSTSTEKRAIQKARCSLPRTPNKRAKIVEKLIQSPSTKKTLEREQFSQKELIKLCRWVMPC